MKPNELKEATLFALDCKVKEIDKQRYFEMEGVKDIINKLIYSIEEHFGTEEKGLASQKVAIG
jgi:hemerythrin